MVEAFLYSSRYANFVKLFTITNILSYNMSIRGSFDNDSLVVKSRATVNYSYSRARVDYSNL